jgi:hypothetical protein
VLYRAAEQERPYFGRGSYWSTSLAFVKHYREWADMWHTEPSLIYRLEVRVDDDVDVADLRPAFGSPYARMVYPPHGVPQRALDDTALNAFAARGFRWLVFQDVGLWEGFDAPSYVYLGTEPLTPERLDDELSRP